MNKYLRNGLLNYPSFGALLYFFGHRPMDRSITFHKWLMTLGPVVFGSGSLPIIYALIHKIEYWSFHYSRQERQDSSRG